MKKIILAGMLLVAGYSLSAQENSNSTNKAPQPIQAYFQTYYPGTVITWTPNGGWWETKYTRDNRINHVYYSSEAYYLVHPVAYQVTLPVLNTYVPESVIEAAIERYGDHLYSISMLRAGTGGMVYQVGLIENGELKNVWMNGEATAYAK